MSRKTKSEGKTKRTNLPVMRPNAAGIDIGATEIWVAVPEGRDPEGMDVRSFPTFTQDLYKLGAWLKQCGVDTVAMESTGVYWIPLYQILEDEGIEVFLVNARHVKTVPGRKTDVRDCQWLQFLHSVGLLQASYRPAQEVCALRTLLRHRQNLVRSSATHIHRMQKSMDQMNVQLQHVINDITGMSGMAIVDAILSGERNPHVLAQLCHKRIRASKEVIAKSLVGDYRPEHIFTLRQSTQAYRNYLEFIEESDREIRRLLDEFESINHTMADDDVLTQKTEDTQKQRDSIITSELKRIFGVDLTKIPSLGVDTVLTLLGEVGPDLSKFRSAGAFANWLTVCPNNQISGGKVLSKHTRKSSSRATTALRFAAQSLHHSKSAFGDYYRRMRAKLGAPKAIVAAAHKLARLIYCLITTRQEYDESHFAASQLRNQKRQEKSLRVKAKALGFELIRTA